MTPIDELRERRARMIETLLRVEESARTAKDAVVRGIARTFHHGDTERERRKDERVREVRG